MADKTLPQTNPAPESSDIGAAVETLMPALRQKARVALMIITLIGAATMGAAVWSLGTIPGIDGAKAAMIAVLVGGATIFYAFRLLRRAQEALVMPVVARTIGMTYEKNAKAFLKALPQRLLPKTAVRSAEDYVHGVLGHHVIRMAEVKIETGGKNSTTLFKGLVAQFPNRVTMPAFFIADETQTRPGMFFGGLIGTDGLHHLRNVKGVSGVTYGVWTSWSNLEEHPALEAVVSILTNLETKVSPAATLFSATSNGEEMHIALTHKRDLFRIGGLFPKDAAIFGDVHAAMRDLSVPLNVARELIAAEAAAAGIGAGKA